MKSRFMPSEEYRKKLQSRHMVEGFSLTGAAVILFLCLIFALDINRSLIVPGTIAVIGGLMNYALAIRGIIVRSWLQAIGLFAVGCVCFGLLAYLNWT
ncbi:MAG TPA: hypothetical protein DHV42_04840 [Lachnospiraceae bacterium]|nr:hypothetical protein [Lachnospiraceae bacterium]